MQLLSFFFVAVGLLVAGYGASLKASESAITLALSIAGVMFTFTFGLSDHRTRCLIKASEVPIAELEARMAARLSIDAVLEIGRAGRDGKTEVVLLPLRRASASCRHGCTDDDRHWPTPRAGSHRHIDPVTAFGTGVGLHFVEG